MKYVRSNENFIRAVTPEVAAIYHLLRARMVNGIIYPNKEEAARKLNVDRSTLSRWLSELIRKGLAEKRHTRHVVLTATEEAIRRANNGVLPKHKCTVVIQDHHNRKDVEQEVRIKLLEEHHRQVEYVSRGTKITQKLKEKYGVIHCNTIKEQVKSRIKIEQDGYVEVSGQAIASRMGLSKRSWQSLQRSLRKEGRISTKQQREILHIDGCPIFMTPSTYAMARDQFGFASFRRANGEVVRVKPNLVRLNTWPLAGNCVKKSANHAQRP